MKKKTIFIIVGVILLAVILGVIIYLLVSSNNDEKKNGEEVSFDEFLKDAVDEINAINAILTSENVSDANAYEGDDGFICKKYTGEDEDEFIERLNNIYVTPFLDSGYFELIETGDENDPNELYVCLPEGCTPRVIDYETVEISTDEEDSKLVNFGGAEYTANKVDGKWKFTFPVTICPLSSLDDNFTGETVHDDSTD